MDSSPFNRSGITRRTPPPTTPCREQPAQIDPPEVVTTSDLHQWTGSVERYLQEICNISSEGKLNSEQKLKISNLCRKVSQGFTHVTVQYQALKNKALIQHYALQDLKEKNDLAVSLTQIKETIKESCSKSVPQNSSFADMVKKGTNNFVRPSPLSSVAIYPSDKSKTSDDTKNIVQKAICPGDINLKVRGVRKIRNGGVIISTETKEDLEKLKKSVQLSSTGLTVDEPKKRNPRLIVLGIPTSMAEPEVFKCIFEQNVAEKLPSLSRDAFLASIKLSHKSGRRDADHCNFIIEVSAALRKALITQDRVFINWTSCPVRDFTIVTRCYNCQQYGHAAKSCQAAAPTCGHCGDEGHSIKDCPKKGAPPKCATCARFKKPSNHQTGDIDCPAKKAAENRYMNSVNYEGA
ncbi:uncharacterized protein LOC111364627 [Spodoptera litura]|uniref:Uncharacterized protein LOC111364627 n=1 Tax=Spodoptera litura TaxID=69820 RepID=A0A9J7EX52_SPOLT|nr:uncharacterized protein LOC111364627 [Spodoptera litura]